MMTHVTPENLEQEELEAHAEEYAAPKDLEDIDEIDWSPTATTIFSMPTK